MKEKKPTKVKVEPGVRIEANDPVLDVFNRCAQAFDAVKLNDLEIDRVLRALRTLLDAD